MIGALRMSRVAWCDVGNPVPGRAGLGPGRAAQADPQAIQRLLNRLLVGLVVVRITGIGFVHEVRNATPMRCPTAPGIKIRGPQFPQLRRIL